MGFSTEILFDGISRFFSRILLNAMAEIKSISFIFTNTIIMHESSKLIYYNLSNSCLRKSYGMSPIRCNCLFACMQCTLTRSTVGRKFIVILSRLTSLCSMDLRGIFFLNVFYGVFEYLTKLWYVHVMDTGQIHVDDAANKILDTVDTWYWNKFSFYRISRLLLCFTNEF